MTQTPDIPTEENPSQHEAAPVIAFESRVTERGYRRVLVQVALLRLRWVLPIVAYIVAAAIARGDHGRAVLWAGMAVGAFVVVLGYALWASGSPSSDKSVLAPVRYSADGSGLGYETASGGGRVSWDQVRRWQHVADHYLLYVGSASYLLVAGESLDVTGARDAFETLLRARVPKGPRPHPPSRIV